MGLHCLSCGEMRHDDLIDQLARRYTAPAYCFLRNVADATGFGRTRAADGLAMGLWPSRGLELHGFEVKVNRSDWRRELKDPAKADAIAVYCDRWWIVALPDIVKPEELPPTWGLMISHPKGRLRIAREAPQMTPRPIDRDFLAAIMRRIGEQKMPEALVARARAEGRQEAEKESHEHINTIRERAREDFEKLRAQVSTFEVASGISINEYTDSHKIGEAVRVVLAGGGEQHRKELGHLRDRCTRILEGLNDAIDGFSVKP